MLNASRHHRVARDRRTLVLGPSLRCSTPLGITASLGLVLCDAGRVGKLVLNASRHHRVARDLTFEKHRALAYVLNASRHHRVARADTIEEPAREPTMCSTPLGITASLGRALCEVIDDAKMCSTPLGITASLGSGQHFVPTTTDVLNASRHHRVARATDRPLTASIVRAQRLSASPRRSGYSSDNPSGDSLCSTPLGITASLGARPLASGALASVLNASRHHRVARADRLGVFPGDLLTVLNASRHHRVARGRCTRDASRQWLCSTPLGITASLGVRARP